MNSFVALQRRMPAPQIMVPGWHWRHMNLPDVSLTRGQTDIHSAPHRPVLRADPPDHRGAGRGGSTYTSRDVFGEAVQFRFKTGDDA